LRLLVVEDDPELRLAMAELLARPGHGVDAVGDGREALLALQTTDYDLAVVDLGLPGLEGLALIRALRRQRVGLPILVVTARDRIEDKVAGLDAGADDYLVKPFEPPELEARARALLRRHQADRAGEIRIGALRMRTGEPRIFLGEQSIDLPPREFGLLEALALRAGRVVRKSSIAARLARGDEQLSDTAIEISVHRLRRRLESHGLQIRTLRGFGYLLEISGDD
jgi:DNA-binding response OmpR family regulator